MNTKCAAQRVIAYHKRVGGKKRRTVGPAGDSRTNKSVHATDNREGQISCFLLDMPTVLNLQPQVLGPCLCVSPVLIHAWRSQPPLVYGARIPRARLRFLPFSWRQEGVHNLAALVCEGMRAWFPRARFEGRQCRHRESLVRATVFSPCRWTRLPLFPR